MTALNPKATVTHADLAEAGKVLEPLAKLADDMDRHATDEWDESELICKTADTIRSLIALATAQAAQIERHEKVIAGLVAVEELSRRNARETFDAMCAMRDSINEHIPMPSLESDLLQGPENSVFCATVADAVVQHVTAQSAALGVSE